VRKSDEAELKSAFQKAVNIRKLSPAAIAKSNAAAAIRPGSLLEPSDRQHTPNEPD